ncbi:hypothetical protein SAMN05443574_101433 [Haloarcula vallismortis]|uniref:Uncharacterized protein n=1 Tax=Haloarcula vallismortis TaxID=28442 RepID=A0A1H2QZV0_HALVA|nr:hypothetical protein SAMN05443574_101433 [Haloarcula vallismortis]
MQWRPGKSLLSLSPSAIQSMLDRLLGRASLKEQVAELEEENHHLERQLDAEKERRADAATERQRAEAEVNRLEDRIVEL